MTTRGRKRGTGNSASLYDWRDPSMPVVRSYKMRDGSTRTEVDPDYESRYREHMMTAAEQPGYKNDPTYNLRKKRT